MARFYAVKIIFNSKSQIKAKNIYWTCFSDKFS